LKKLRRALVVLAALIVVAGAFTAGALIFRGGGDRNVSKAIISCDTTDECRDRKEAERRALCNEGVDALRITVILTVEGDEYARRVFTADC
jgi:hypothetical protein